MLTHKHARARSHTNMHMCMRAIPYGREGKIPYKCEGKRMGWCCAPNVLRLQQVRTSWAWQDTKALKALKGLVLRTILPNFTRIHRGCGRSLEKYCGRGIQLGTGSEEEDSTQYVGCRYATCHDVTSTHRSVSTNPVNILLPITTRSICHAD